MLISSNSIKLTGYYPEIIINNYVVYIFKMMINLV